MTYRSLLLVALLIASTTPAEAGIFFNRNKTKVDPKLRVPELITAVRSDKDADKRARAAEELRTYDAQQFPDILPVLIDALAKDENPSVRIEAAQGIGKIRPVTRQAGEALEQCLANDRSMRVRLQARSTLMGYQWAGYRSGMKDATPANDPINAGKNPPAISTTNKNSTPIRLSPTPANAARTVTTREPPLAAPQEEPPVVPPATTSPPPLPMNRPAVAPTPTTPIPLPGNGGKSEGPELP